MQQPLYGFHEVPRVTLLCRVGFRPCVLARNGFSWRPAQFLKAGSYRGEVIRRTGEH